MDIVVDEYVKLLTDETASGKVIVIKNNTTIIEAKVPSYGANEYVLPMGTVAL